MFDFQARQAYLRVLWGPDKENMSGYINPDLLSFSYHDKDGDEADEISISLKDETGKWAGSWSPDGGMVLQAFIATGTPLIKGDVAKVLRRTVSASPFFYTLFWLFHLVVNSFAF